MKRLKHLLSLCFATLLSLALAACGAKDAAATAPFVPDSDSQTLLTSGAFSEALTEIDAAIACELYGIDADTVTDCRVYGSTGTTAEELALFTCSDSDAAATVAQQLNYRIEDRKEELENYLPDEIAKLNEAVVVCRGESVLLVIAADYAPVTAFLG